MSSNPASVSASAIYSSLWSPSVWSRLELKSPATSSSNPWGCSLSATTALYIVEVSLGAR